MTKRITVAAGAVGAWIPLDRRSYGTIGFTVRPHTSSAGTYSVNFTSSPLQQGRENCVLSRSTTALTITYPAHGLTTADDVIVSGVLGADYGGRYKVASVVDANNITVTVADAGTATRGTVAPVVVDTVTDFSGASGLNSGNIFASISAFRLDATDVTTAPADLIYNQVENN
jgi:hypothetical protein